MEKKIPVKRSVEQKYELWKMYFDSSSSKKGAGVGIMLISPGGESVSLMYKLEFITTCWPGKGAQKGISHMKPRKMHHVCNRSKGISQKEKRAHSGKIERCTEKERQA